MKRSPLRVWGAVGAGLGAIRAGAGFTLCGEPFGRTAPRATPAEPGLLSAGHWGRRGASAPPAPACVGPMLSTAHIQRLGGGADPRAQPGVQLWTRGPHFTGSGGGQTEACPC